MLAALTGSLLTIPLLGLIIHLLLTDSPLANQIRKLAQTALLIFWSTIIVLLFISTTHPQAIMMGNWQAPFGITLVSDQLSNTMLVVFAIVALCINFYSYQDQAVDHKPQAFYSGFWLLLLGVSGALLTNDIFNLYVWFEVMLVSAFILLASSSQKKPVAILHYALMNILGTLLMLLAIAFIYGVFGTLSYVEIAEKLSLTNAAHSTLPIMCLLLFAMGIKGAIFPLYFWLPNAYTKPSISSTMLLSSLITKVVMVILLRLAWLWLPLYQPFLHQSLLWLAWATMFFGVMGAANQFRMKNILAFHIISQLGYILLAITLPTQLAIIGAVYFMIHNIFVKTHLFMIAGIIEAHTGTDDLKKLGNLLSQNTWLAIVFFLAAMSLAGFPPLSGFWAKFLVLKAAISAQAYTSAFMAIVVSLFTLYSMIKLWRYVFCEPAKNQANLKPNAIKCSGYLMLAILPLCILPIIMGIWPDSVLVTLAKIAQQLSNPNDYIQLILAH